MISSPKFPGNNFIFRQIYVIGPYLERVIYSETNMVNIFTMIYNDNLTIFPWEIDS